MSSRYEFDSLLLHHFMRRRFAGQREVGFGGRAALGVLLSGPEELSSGCTRHRFLKQFRSGAYGVWLGRVYPTIANRD